MLGVRPYICFVEKSKASIVQYYELFGGNRTYEISAFYQAQWSPTPELRTGTRPRINWYRSAQEILS